MPPSIMEHYRRAQDSFGAVLEQVPPDGWDVPSAAAPWTVRDVAGHAIWSQEQIRHWATGQEYGRDDGAPGAPHPARLAGDDPVATWAAARAAADAALTDENLARPLSLPVLGETTVLGVVATLVTDLAAHAWDIAHPLGLDVRLDTDLVAVSFTWARDNAIRAPGFFGPELAPPPDADEQTRWLAFLGRAPWQPVAS